MRASKNRCFHLAMVRELSLKLEYKSPAANRKMMRARRAKSARPRPVRARDSRALRSSPVSTMSAVVCGMRHTNIYMSLVQATSGSEAIVDLRWLPHHAVGHILKRRKDVGDQECAGPWRRHEPRSRYRNYQRGDSGGGRRGGRHGLFSSRRLFHQTKLG